jgi:hypothetical protein
VLSHALTNLGLARWQSGDPEGHEDLREAVRVALSINDVEDACRAYVGLVWSLCRDGSGTSSSRGIEGA